MIDFKRVHMWPLIMGILVGGFSFLPALAEDQESSVLAERDYANNVDKIAQLAVGLELGRVSGMTLEYWLQPDRVFNLSLGVADGNTELGLAHLWMLKNTFSSFPKPRLAYSLEPYVGVGLLFGFGTNEDYFSRHSQNTDNSASALQIPVGLEFLPKDQRFSLFAELAPSFEMAPVSSIFLTADLGARFYF